MTSTASAPPGARPPRRDPSLLASILVDWSVRRPWLVIWVSVILTVLGGWVAATRFAITTETDQLLHSDSKWIQDKDVYQAAFPQLSKPILVVVDGRTPQQAEAAAQQLADKLRSEPKGLLSRVWRPDGGPFFDRNGLLFLPPDQVKATVEGLEAQAPTLSALSGDPTLRGLLRLLQIGAMRGALDGNVGLLRQIDDVLGRVLLGEGARLSWQSVLSQKPAEPGELRKFVLADPVLDYEALQPAAGASARIRQAASELGLKPQDGVTVRLTGAPPLADEEFSSIEEGAPYHLGLTVVAIAVILFLALRSGRIIFAVLATTLAGLVITVAAGLLMVGRFNVISVAVAALFLGLGVDFGIQVAVRYRDERFKLDDVTGALHRTAHGIGWSLTLAAASLLAGFFAFLPTSFTGVSELGLITGVGMIIAFVASLTLLPALVAVLRPPGEADSVETQALAAVDHWIHRHRRLVIVGSTLLTVAGLPLLLRLEFDANPMHLRSDKTEAVATFLDLTRQPGLTPNTLAVLAPSLDAARQLQTRLEKLPEVARTVSAAVFTPPDQDGKLQLIRGAAEKLDGFVNAPAPAPPPTDEELTDTIRRASSALLTKAGTEGGGINDVLRALGDKLARLAGAPADRRAAAATALTGDLPGLLAQLRSLLRPEPVTLASLPDDLRSDWVTADGRARVEVSPKGDANDNEVIERFTDAVRAVAPNVAGAPIDVVESRAVIVRAFVTAGVLALIAIFAILTLALRRPKDVALTLGPLVLATVMTLEAARLIDMPLNLANIIALPLMLAVGVNFHIYYMIAWRNGVADMLASSLTRAIFFSSLTTGVAFGSLWLSNHPGTASMGKLLTLSLFFTLLAAFIIVPAFLGPPEDASKKA